MKGFLLSLLFVSTSLLAHPLSVVREEIKKNGKGILIMDLDETILDSHTRKYHAFLEAHQKHCGKPQNTLQSPVSSDCEKLLGLSKIDFYRLENGYSVYELMGKLGIPYSPFVREVSQTMVELYLGGQWMDQDSPMPGATTFVREMKRLGAEVYFVSARYDHLQRRGSLESLIRLGFMQKGEESYLILREKNQEAVEFKALSMNKIKEESRKRNVPVVALFENESENINVWKKAFPEAHAFFIKGNTLLKTPLAPGVMQISDYR